MATMTHSEIYRVPARETAITLCLEVSRELFRLQDQKRVIQPTDPVYNAWFVVRRTAESFKEGLALGRKASCELDDALFTYHSLACPDNRGHFDVCDCSAALLIRRLLSVVEGEDAA